ncbi:MAG: VOC family protein [Anaerolineae bacterium]|nr:VOC family protein [Anaerolineae bacterium]
MQNITPCLWYESQSEAAIQFLTSTFQNSRVKTIQRYPEGPLEAPMKGMEGKVLTAVFELEGHPMMTLDGGPYFKFTPAISFFVNCETEEEIDRLWAKLSEGGSVMMPFQEYPFSKKFGWVEDKFGLSWQVNLGARGQKITPFLMFTGDQFGKAEEAMQFYTSLFENSGIDRIERYGAGENGQDGRVKHAVFRLHGQELMTMDSNYEHGFTFNEAISLCVECDTQEEIDYLWDNLSAVPEAEQCGCLKDKFGVSWQIVPTMLPEVMQDPQKTKQVMDAFLQMKKFDIATLRKAYEG